MWITGCCPKRAGNDFFAKIKKDFSMIDYFAEKQNVKTDLFKFPLRDMIDNFVGCFSSALNNSFKDGIKSHKNFVYQGTLFFAEGNLINNIFFKEEFPRLLFKIMYDTADLKINPRFTYFDATTSGGDDFPKLTMVKVFTYKKNIKSYLYGDDNFRFPHWFVDKNADDYENIDETLRIVKLNSLSDAKEFFKGFSKKTDFTECVFCSEKIYKHARELIGNKFGYDMVLRVG